MNQKYGEKQLGMKLLRIKALRDAMLSQAQWVELVWILSWINQIKRKYLKEKENITDLYNIKSFAICSMAECIG